MKYFNLIFCFIWVTQSFAQETFPVNGTHHENHLYYCFKNATIHVDYQSVVKEGTLIIQDGRVVAIGDNIEIPKGAVVYNLKGKHIYPSIIDPYSDYGMPEIPKQKRQSGPQFVSNKKGAFGWNQAIKPEIDAAELFSYNKSQAASYRKAGFGALLTHQKDGIVRGTSTAVLLGENDNMSMLKSYAALHFSFQKGSSTQDYPGSLMGAIALLRQTYYDAEWYKKQKEKVEHNISLEAFINNQTLPSIFEVRDYQTAIRADKVGDEFNVQYIIKGAGDEYKRIDKIKETDAAFILPVNFPKVYDVEDPYDALVASIEDIKHWELAPSNPAILEQNDILFAFTSDGLESPDDFIGQVRKAIQRGLSEETALKAITYNPAMLLGAQDELGSLHPDKYANFIITSDELFNKDMAIYENWVKGKQYVIKDYNAIDVRGTYDLTVDGQKFKLVLEGSNNSPKAKLEMDTTKIKVSFTQESNLVSLSFKVPNGPLMGLITLSGKLDNKSTKWNGKGQKGKGEWISWEASRIAKHEEDKKSEEQLDSLIGKAWLPSLAYGFETFPSKNSYLIKNATVWTCEEEGILQNTDVLISNGKIKQIGENLTADGIDVIDAKGMHLTPGIVDEHSHIAISRGVNECTQAVTAEVSIADVVNADDINIYRQLAGGVTAAQLLHGSCNPVGGQSALIKLRWGRSAEDMKIKNTDGFIKFALGENVKRSNFGDSHTERFPQTRMGVEQVYYDAFTRAMEYQVDWAKYLVSYSGAKKKEKDNIIAPRRDLELDILSQILNEKRFISCHSYQQGEINMLMHVGDSMGFRINTFTHILEGYKVADKMKEHGAGGSTFSDWWAYKFEVNDAIPYNGAIMHEQGIVTAFNSDDAEMGRRLNQEAAKAVKYGGVSEEDALKFVTLNPAKLLHLDNRMGSVKVGKDADLVLWTDHPLSIYAKASKTMIDGIVYYDIERDLELRSRNQEEKMRLLEKMIEAKKNGEPVQKPQPKKDRLYHCDSVTDEI